MSQTYDWSRFALRINVNAPIDKLYNAWATKKGIEHWFLRKCEYKKADGSLCKDDEPVQKGDIYAWEWYGYDIVEHGKVLDCNGRDFFKFSFGKAGDCSVTIRQEEGATIVELVQENIPTDEFGMKEFHLGCNQGWTFHLSDLKSIYEGGLDLRNKDSRLKRLFNS